MRIEKHPILGDLGKKEAVAISVDGKKMEARAGETIAAALTAHGIKVFRKTHRFQENRGIFCAIGRCTDCVMTVNGIPNVRTCHTLVEDGMVIKSQVGLGEWERAE